MYFNTNMFSIVKTLYILCNIQHIFAFYGNIPVNRHIPKTVKKNWDTRKTIVKFGGSSLESSKRLVNVGKIIKNMVDKGENPIIVCSALGKTTNNILDAGNIGLNEGEFSIDKIKKLHLSICDDLDIDNDTRSEIKVLLDGLETLLTGVSIIGELTPRNKDKLVSFGEKMSVRVVSSLLRNMGIRSNHCEAGDIGIRTTDDFGNAEILDITYPLVYETISNMDDDIVPVVTGFLGETVCRNTTTLGRGGSDLTATVLGVSMGAKEIQVWKDVNGMMTADPRVIPGAISVPHVSYEEASELAYFGGNILHPISMRPAMGTDIPIRIKNSYNPSHPGTLITSERRKSDNLVTAITFKKGVELIDIVSTRMLGQSGFLSRVFYQFSKYSLSIDMIATSDVSISLTLDQNQERDIIRKCLQDLGDVSEVKGHRNRAIISLVSDVSRSSEVMSEVFSVFKETDVKVLMISQGASKVNIGVVVPEDQLDVAVRALHKHFFE